MILKQLTAPLLSPSPLPPYPSSPVLSPPLSSSPSLPRSPPRTHNPTLTSRWRPSVPVAFGQMRFWRRWSLTQMHCAPLLYAHGHGHGTQQIPSSPRVPMALCQTRHWRRWNWTRMLCAPLKYATSQAAASRPRVRTTPTCATHPCAPRAPPRPTPHVKPIALGQNPQPHLSRLTRLPHPMLS